MAIIKRIGRNPLEADNNKLGLINSASALLRWAKNIGVYKIPLDLFLIAKKANISIEYRGDLGEDISGSFRKEEGKYVITINKLHHKRRQRFTLAHELAHFFLHRNLNSFFEDSVFFRGGKMSSEEYQANLFAAEILMPEEEFRSQVSLGKNSISELADFFQVSSLAVRIRAQQLGFGGHGL